jgi:hypothetical protein
VTTQVGVIDSDGYMRARTEYTGPPLDLRDREHFQVHVDAKADQLFISKPIVLRATGNSSIQFTRRLRKPDGSFGGVIVASVNPVFAEQFYNSVKLGAHSSVSLRGLDGAVRASYGLSVSNDFNANMPKGLAEMLHLATEGHFWGGGRTDGVNRLVSYRVVTGYPLLISIGETESRILADYELHRKIYFAMAAFLTLLVLIASTIGIRRQSSLERSKLSLEQTNNRFSSAIENMTPIARRLSNRHVTL